MSARRSSRETKKPELFNPKNYDSIKARGGSAATSFATAAGDGYESNSSADRSEDDSDFDNQDRVVFAHKLPLHLSKRVAGGKAPAAGVEGQSSSSMSMSSMQVQSNTDGIAKGGKSALGARAYIESTSVIFNAVQSDASEVDFISVTNDWIRRFQKDRVSAMCELVNFVLFMAGATEEVLDNDIDLDALESDEILELLSKFIKQLLDENENVRFPLEEWVKKGRNPVSLRQRYVAFWMDFGNRLVSQVGKTANSQRGSDLETLHHIIDQLISFSSLVISKVRNSVTEAILTLCTVLVSFQKEISELTENLEKQAGVPSRPSSQNSKKTIGKSGDSSSSSAKLSMVHTQLNAFQKVLDEVREILETAFKSVFLHRYIDTNVNIRKLCILKLGDWISCDPMFYFKIEYLKYFGNHLSDVSPLVRIQAVQCISRFATGISNKYSDVLSDFVDRFTSRLIEMAVGDMDSGVQYEMILLLKTLQQTGMIDIWPEESLDKVDSAVFDERATPRVRREALSFFMDHTQGFEAIDDDGGDDMMMKTSAASSSKSKGGNQEAKSMAMKKKKNAFQIETLLEFAECHVRTESVEKVELLADACIDIPDYYLLYDWQTMLSLLLKETDDIITTALQPFQVSMLLIMFRRGVESIKEKVDKDESKKGSSSSSKISVEILRQWELLNSLMSRDMHKLLTRFRDNVGNLFNLLGILTKLDIPSSLTQFRAILKSLEDLFLICTDDALLAQISVIFVTWSSSPHPGSDVSNTITRLINSSLQGVSTLIDRYDNALEMGTNADAPTKSKLVRKTSSSSSSSAFSEDDNLTSCALSFLRLKSLWTRMNCSLFLPEKFKSFNSIINKLVGILTTIMLTDFSETKAKSILIILRESSALLFLMTLFEVTTLKRGCQLTNEITPDIKSQVEKVVNFRDQFVNCASQVMEINRDFDFSAKSQIIFRDLQRELFQKFCQVQFIFSFQEQFALVNEEEGFIFKPSRNMLMKIKTVFDREVQCLRDEIESCELDSFDNKLFIDKRSEILVSMLLKPLSSSMFNTASEDTFNKKQAASILVHISIPSEVVNVFMKDFVKTIKEWGPEQHFDVQLLTFKMLYIEKIVPNLNILSDYEEIDEADDGIHEIMEALDYEFNNLRSIAKKLSNSVGIGKAKGEVLTSLVGFFDKAVEFALKGKLNLAFLEILPDFSRFLPASYLTAQKQSITRALTEAPASDWINELIEQSNRSLLSQLKSFCQQFIPEYESELTNLNLRVGASLTKKNKSRQSDKDNKGKKRKADVSNSSSLNSNAAGTSHFGGAHNSKFDANSKSSSPLHSRAPPLQITKGNPSSIATFGRNSKASSSAPDDDYFEDRDPKRQMVSKTNDSRPMTFNKENVVKAPATIAVNKNQNQTQKNTFHLGLELEEIDEMSSDEDEYNDNEDGDGDLRSPIIDELDDDEFEVSELYKSIPPKNRAAVKY